MINLFYKYYFERYKEIDCKMEGDKRELAKKMAASRTKQGGARRPLGGGVQQPNNNSPFGFFG